MQDQQQPIHRWDSRREESCFSELEEVFSQELRSAVGFVDVALDFANRFSGHIRRLPSGFSHDLLVDLICSANCLCLRFWRDYVRLNQHSANPEELVRILQSLPRLDDYLSCVGLDRNIVTRFPTLAKEDLVSRNAYADGGRKEDYVAKYGLRIQSPDPSLVIVPTMETEAFRDHFGSSFVDDNGIINLNKRFHLLQRLSIGRQKSNELGPFDVVYGGDSHRMIIAGKMDSKVASREQLEVVVLTPEVIYAKNAGSLFAIHIHPIIGDSIVLGIGQSCIVSSDVRILCNKVQLEIVSSQSERKR